MEVTGKYPIIRSVPLLATGLFAFYVQPFLTLLILFSIVSTRKIINIKQLSAVLFFAVLYISLVNTSKYPESDLENYVQAFLSAREMDLVEYLIIYNRELLYYLSLYLFALIPWSGIHSYIFFSTLLPYLIFGAALLRLGKSIGLDSHLILRLIISFIFFPQLFSLSGHLLRQFLAAALLMLFLSDFVVVGVRKWGVAFLGGLMHYSAVALLFLAIARPLRNFSPILNLHLYSLLIPLVYMAAVLAAPVFLDFPVLGVIAGRISSGEGHDLESLGLPAVFMAIILGLLSFYGLIFKKFWREDGRAWLVYFISSVVVVLVLAASANASLSEIALRYFFYLYFLIGLVVLLLCPTSKRLRFLVKLSPFLALPYYFYKLGYGEWAYAPVGQLIFGPSWILWGYYDY